jgi:threonine synthase
VTIGQEGCLSGYATDLPAVATFVSLGEGNTPVVSLPAIARRLGLARLSAKLELLNPTGSYKDRVAAMSLSLARSRGNAGWIATSSGNAGMAMAAYGARAGLPGFLALGGSAPLEKRAPLIPFGLTVVAVEGIGADASKELDHDFFWAVRSGADRHGLYLGITCHAYNPDGMRGIDTLGYELAAQVPGLSHVYLPAGSGGLLVAVARGLRHRQANPKVIACQPAGCAPIVGCLQASLRVPEIDRCESAVSALQLPSPPDGDLAVQAVTASGGWGTAVSDAEIFTAQRALAETEGIFVEPAAATGLAALAADAAAGRLGPDDHPVLVLTGAGWKDLGRFAGPASSIPVVTVGEIGSRVDQWLANLDQNGDGE